MPGLWGLALIVFFDVFALGGLYNVLPSGKKLASIRISAFPTEP